MQVSLFIKKVPVLMGNSQLGRANCALMKLSEDGKPDRYTLVTADPAVLFQSMTMAMTGDQIDYDLGVPDGSVERVILTSLHSLVEATPANTRLLGPRPALAKDFKLRMCISTQREAANLSGPSWLDPVRGLTNQFSALEQALQIGCLRFLTDQVTGSGPIVLVTIGLKLALFKNEVPGDFFEGEKALFPGYTRIPPYAD